MNTLRFDGSLWVNLDIALRNLDRVYEQVAARIGVSVVEWYVLRALFEQDGQRPSDLAQLIGRPATSFTPILDHLQRKKLIERRPDPRDRRVVHVHLTRKGKSLRNEVLTSANELDTCIPSRVGNDEWEGFARVLAGLQTLQSSGQ